MNTRSSVLPGAVLIAALCGGAQAQVATPCVAPTSGLYGVGFLVQPGAEAASCGTAGFNTVGTLFDGLGTNGLRAVNPDYTGTEPASLDLFFNSLPMNLAYPVEGATGAGTRLLFRIPALGVAVEFNGVTRDDSEQQLEDYLKNSGVIGEMMRYQAANSPHSPISGPGGLIPTAVAADFADAFDTLPSRAETQPGNLIGVGLNFTSFSVKDLDTRVTTLPLSYTIRNNIDPRRKLVLGMPITMSDTEGAKFYHLSPGVSYRVPMNDAWSIAPAVRLGVVASEDMATVSGVASASVSSTYVMRFASFDMAIGNMLGYYTTLRVEAGDYSFNPDIDNVVLRNGVMFSQPVTVGGMPLSVEYSLIDTRYLGTEIYVNNTQELGITLGTNRSAFSSRSFVRGGLNFLYGPDTSGLSANIGYWF